MDNIIDARNLTCPQPVILTKKAMDNNPSLSLTTIVSNDIAKENVTKLATSCGYDVEVEEKGDGIYLHLNRDNPAVIKEAAKGEVAVLITSQYFGQGEEELGRVLMNSFLYTLTEMADELSHIILMNAGVFLASAGSPVINHLQVLQERGIEILVCGTCIDFYNLNEKLEVGKVTNMYTALDIMTDAVKNITI
ncbi:MAG: sulfurtransferase-like selenium metabolism protein YedF [Syntrophomonadaceae bacterium]|nr:sulfurtransferase-like selenium metabolism protein YedF [Syntrophomonadaceae bacterium]